jgi:hypothetical protein
MRYVLEDEGYAVLTLTIQEVLNIVTNFRKIKQNAKYANG